jgi:tRNA-modifying protein YgfZ
MSRLFSLIEVSGDDAAEFLQGQLTQDLEGLATAPGLPAAWCNARGRVIVVLRVTGTATDGFGLVVPHASADAIVRRLAMFRMRSRVDIAAAGDDWLAKATRSGDDLEHLDSLGLLPEAKRFSARNRGGIVAFELGGASRCIELFGHASAFEEAGVRLRHELDGAGWQSALIEAGVPNVAGDTSERFTAHMLNLDLLGAISFAKGCYSGQEVIARTQHLGQSKRRLARYRLAAGLTEGLTEGLTAGSAAPGDRLEHDGRDVGEVVNAAGPDLLAVVPLELSGASLTRAGAKAEPVPLPYALPL